MTENEKTLLGNLLSECGTKHPACGARADCPIRRRLAKSDKPTEPAAPTETHEAEPTMPAETHEIEPVMPADTREAGPMYDPNGLMHAIEAYRCRHMAEIQSQCDADNRKLKELMDSPKWLATLKEAAKVIEVADHALAAGIDLSGFTVTPGTRYGTGLVIKSRWTDGMASVQPSAMFLYDGTTIEFKHTANMKSDAEEIHASLACAENFYRSFQTFRDSLYGYLYGIVTH